MDVCRLPDSDRLRYIDKCKSSGIDKCPNDIRRTELTGDSVAIQDGVDMTVKSYWKWRQCYSMYRSIYFCL